MTDNNVYGRNLNIRVQANQPSTRNNLLESEDCRSVSDETRLHQTPCNIGLYVLTLLICAGAPHKKFPIEIEQALPEEHGLPEREEVRQPAERPPQSLGDYLFMGFVGAFVSLPIAFALYNVMLYIKDSVSEVLHILNSVYNNNTVTSLL